MVEECPADELTKFVQNINRETNEKTVAQTAQEIQHTFGSLKQVNICMNDIHWYEINKNIVLLIFSLQIFTIDVYRGLLGLATWWTCFALFATTAMGMFYQSYFSTM